MMRIREIVLDILFPKKCLGCNKEGKYICKNCELFMLDLSEAWPLTSFWEYNGIIKKAIHQIKYGGTYDMVRELVNKKEFEIDKNTIITFVPMYIKKEKERGFNQAEIIAKELRKKTGLPVAKLLEKVKETSDQASLDREHRLTNLKNTFAICDKPGLYKPCLLQNILLVDDVYTTGATMEECRKVLYKAGFRNINYFTLARTV